MLHRTPNTTATDTDQTRFATEEPMFENVAGLPPDENPKIVGPKKPLLKRKGVIIGLIIGTTALVLLVLFIINLIIMRNRTPQVVYPKGIENTASTNENNPLIKKVVELKKELRSADPNQVKFVFPSVNLELELDRSR